MGVVLIADDSSISYVFLCFAGANHLEESLPSNIEKLTSLYTLKLSK